MTVYHDPGDAAIVDIILIHGLRGSAEESWMHGSCLWPRNLLGHDMGGARIMSWGWDSSAARMTGYSSQVTLHQHAETFLSDLQDLRSNSSEVLTNNAAWPALPIRLMEI